VSLKIAYGYEYTVDDWRRSTIGLEQTIKFLFVSQEQQRRPCSHKYLRDWSYQKHAARRKHELSRLPLRISKSGDLYVVRSG
jgi:hypothetical protein